LRGVSLVRLPIPVLLRRVLVPALACLLLTAFAPGAAAQSARTTVDFDGDWLFSRGDFANAMGARFDDAAWRRLDVPHDWSNEGPFEQKNASGSGFAPGGIGWYRKHFALDPAQRGRVVEIQFDGVYDYAQVWINGQYAGGRPYGFESFHLDLSRYVNFGGDNVLAVRVDHSRVGDSRWYTGSGIYRHVRLVVADTLRLATDGVFVSTPRVGDVSALVRVETTLVNASAVSRDYALQSDVVGPDGRVAGGRRIAGQLAPGQRQLLEQEIEVPAPQRWSLDAPVLYSLRSRVSGAGVAVDEVSTAFGIRTLKFDPDRGFLLNDRPVKLKGVCIHGDGGSVGVAVPDKVLERRLRLLKDLGVNAIRTSHNPPAPELLALCDRIGLLVKDEAFDEFTPPKNKWVEGWNVGQPGKFGYGELFEEWSVRDIGDFVRRDRNHPSVIMWSIGNEIDYANDPFSHPVLGMAYRPTNPPAKDLVRLAAPLIAAIKELDPTRPVTAALANVGMSDAVGLGERLDIVGYNYQEDRYPADHQRFPKRVIFGSENHHDYRAWAAARDNDYVAGQFLWTGIDYLGEARLWPSRGNGAGLLDFCGFKKPVGWFRQSLWSAQPMVYICASPDAVSPAVSPAGDALARFGQLQEHWNWPENSTITVSCFSNCPEVQLTLNGQSVGTKRLEEAEEGVLSWTVPYQPGILKAVGLKDGRPACEYSIRTAGAAIQVRLLPGTTEISADGKDVCHVEYQILDANGAIVPDAANEVSFEVQGPGKIIGLGNGDLANSEDPRGAAHRAYKGRGLAIIQAGRIPGSIILKATSPNLDPDTVLVSSR